MLHVIKDRDEAAAALKNLVAPEAGTTHERLFKELQTREAEMEKICALDEKIATELAFLEKKIADLRSDLADLVAGREPARRDEVKPPVPYGSGTSTGYPQWRKFTELLKDLRVSKDVSFLSLVDFLFDPVSAISRAVRGINEGIRARKNRLAPQIKELRLQRSIYQSVENEITQERDRSRREAEAAAQSALAQELRWRLEAAEAAGRARAAEDARLRAADEAAFLAADGAMAADAARTAAADEAARDMKAFLEHWRDDAAARRAVEGAFAARGCGPRAFDVAAAVARRRGGFGALCETLQARLDLPADLIAEVAHVVVQAAPRGEADDRGAPASQDDFLDLAAKFDRLTASVDRLADRLDVDASKFSSSTVRGLIEAADAPHRSRRHAQDRLAAGLSASASGSGSAGARKQRRSRGDQSRSTAGGAGSPAGSRSNASLGSSLPAMHAHARFS